MADEKKVPNIEQETIKPEPDRKKQLSEKDLDKVSGGEGHSKWIEISKV